MDIAPVTCPSCFEVFSVPLPASSEVPCELDYDCEVCCRPMMIQCWSDELDGVSVEAYGLED